MAGTVRLKMVLVEKRRASGLGRGHRHGNTELVLPGAVVPQLVLMGRGDGEIILKTGYSRTSTAIPNRSNRCSRPARTESPTVVSPPVKTRSAEVVPFSIVPVITRHRVDIPRAAAAFTGNALQRLLLHVERHAVAEWLLIARQEAIAVPM